ncbi:30S ribosomal protein S1 [Clostridium perfringens]|uniref:30S ribosomal protein S1 n=1 Tax=Clostridium perfringens TaxID=1502 RepID=UPI001A192E82|nr:30S ribosomal protein S1 [Clostridium perfringens]STB16367.1 30S ribosomal protein S1 [Clostridium novyi]ELC8349308.1 30S ribosomal protein S1 [Clostridium perfringens]ELC8387265.1 30S ribosomal protein S1 [Clostridium perfringens]ELC8407607.1 30S ribosomal protein S1 [Clostridium perfringens]MCX0356891.1 30S ribosomal protein S1 [Clostridium perfringens]
MSENLTMSELMDSFELKHFHKGEIVKGKVISVKNDEIIVNIGHFADGVVPRNEISNDKNFDINSINVDDDIFVMVLSGDDGEGNVLLSKKRADAIKVWDDLKEAFEKEKSIKVSLKEVVKGGIVGDFNGLRVFMPASQCAGRRIENLEELVGKTLEVRVIEFNKENRKVVVSRRVIDEEIRNNEKKALWSSIKEGEKRKGKVTRLAKFGAFVDIGGVEGLVHLSDMSWSRVHKPEEVVSVGDEVEVFVSEVDIDRERIALSLKDVIKNPWETLEGLKVGDVVSGKVTNFIKVGAFVEVLPGIEGLVHISEITDENIAKPSDILELGQEVKVKILNIDDENKKMSLSIKDAVETSNEYMQYNDEEEGYSLADLFKGLNL